MLAQQAMSDLIFPDPEPRAKLLSLMSDHIHVGSTIEQYKGFVKAKYPSLDIEAINKLAEEMAKAKSERKDILKSLQAKHQLVFDRKLQEIIKASTPTD